MKLTNQDIHPLNKTPIKELLDQAKGLNDGTLEFNFFVNDGIAVRVTTSQRLSYGNTRDS